jgi:hypothetical protein
MTHDLWKVAAGLSACGFLASYPLWQRIAFGQEPAPVSVPVDGACIEPLDQIRADHMQLLARWRDDVVRGNDLAVAVAGVEREKGLESVCLDCHRDPAAFCERCHDAAGIRTDCFDCHSAGATGQAP